MAIHLLSITGLISLHTVTLVKIIKKWNFDQIVQYFDQLAHGHNDNEASVK